MSWDMSDGEAHRIDEPTEEDYKRQKFNCIRCNDNGCPACDSTKGSKYNPEPY
jgi:hypothetical protein